MFTAIDKNAFETSITSLGGKKGFVWASATGLSPLLFCSSSNLLIGNHFNPYIANL